MNLCELRRFDKNRSAGFSCQLQEMNCPKRMSKSTNYYYIRFPMRLLGRVNAIAKGQRAEGPSHLLIQTGIAGGHTETDNMRPEGRIRKTCCATWLDEQREQWTRGDLSLPLRPSAPLPCAFPAFRRGYSDSTFEPSSFRSRDSLSGWLRPIRNSTLFKLGAYAVSRTFLEWHASCYQRR